MTSTPSARFLSRYDDTTPPTAQSWLLDVLKRALPPMVALFALNAAVGLFIVHVLQGNFAEDSVNRYLQDRRTPTLDAFAAFGSAMGSVMTNIIGCLVLMALIWLITRKWWVAVLPGLALVLQAILHMAVSGLVDRLRPVGVEQLDAAPPTAAFPSGHTGATLTQLVVIAFLLSRLHRRLVTVLAWALAVVYTGVVIWARLYQGMHAVTDVGMGIVNGVTCAIIAWLTLRRAPVAEPAPQRSGV